MRNLTRPVGQRLSPDSTLGISEACSMLFFNVKLFKYSTASYRQAKAVTGRKDEASTAVQVAMAKEAELNSIFSDGGLIQTISGRQCQKR